MMTRFNTIFLESTYNHFHLVSAFQHSSSVPRLALECMAGSKDYTSARKALDQLSYNWQLEETVRKQLYFYFPTLSPHYVHDYDTTTACQQLDLELKLAHA
jgi:hypothetical protein